MAFTLQLENESNRSALKVTTTCFLILHPVAATTLDLSLCAFSLPRVAVSSNRPPSSGPTNNIGRSRIAADGDDDVVVVLGVLKRRS